MFGRPREKLPVPVIQLVMHYLAPLEGGPIRSTRRAVDQDGLTTVVSYGGSYAVACQPKRPYLARATGRGRSMKLTEPFHATGQMFREAGGTIQELVTCPKCKASELYQRDEAAQRAAVSGQ